MSESKAEMKRFFQEEITRLESEISVYAAHFEKEKEEEKTLLKENIYLLTERDEWRRRARSAEDKSKNYQIAYDHLRESYDKALDIASRATAKLSIEQDGCDVGVDYCRQNIASQIECSLST